MKRKRQKNLSLNPRLLEFGEAFCEASNRNFTDYIQELLREDLRERGFPVDADLDAVLKFVADKRKAESPKKK